MRIIYMSTGTFGVPILKALNEKYEIALVISQPDYITKKKTIKTPIHECCLELGLNIFQPEKLNENYEMIKEVNADVLVTASYGQFISTKILNLFEKTINVHGSLLPKYRGGAPIQRSIINGDTETGITIMEMKKGMDTGGIYKMKSIAIDPLDNSTTLFAKLSLLGRDLLMETIEDIKNGVLVAIPQDESKVTFAYNLTKEEEHIDFNQNVEDIVNQIRGFAMEIGMYFSIKDNLIKVYQARKFSSNTKFACGTVVDNNKKIIVACKNGEIELELIKPAGKNMMKVKDYLNGSKLFEIGDILY